MKQRKGRGGGGKLLPDHVLSLRSRLHDALALGLKSDGHNAKKWECADAGIESHALKTIAAFVSCISHELLRLPPIKETISDILTALEGILRSKNGAVLTLAADVSLKLVSSIGNSIRQYPVLQIIISLSSLLSTEQHPISVSCASSLNCILTNLVTVRVSNHREVWEALEKTNALGSVVHALQSYTYDVHAPKYLMEMVTLLRTIVWIWPPSRYRVWSNSELMEKLEQYCSSTETMVTARIFKLYSALALCGNGAMSLLKNEGLLVKIGELIGKSNPNNIRIEALKLCQVLVRSSKGCCFLLMTSHCEPIVQGIIDAMCKRSSYSAREFGDEKSLATEGYRSALMVLRYAGNHHFYFWNDAVDEVLYEVLTCSCISSHKIQNISSQDELFSIVCTNIVDIHPYVWEILGYLAVHCTDEYLHKRSGTNHYLEVLITCACSLALDVMQRNTSIQSSTYEQEPALRAVIMMLLSPCSYISSQARSKFTEIVEPSSDAYLNIMLPSLESTSNGSVTKTFDAIRVMINLMSLACLSMLPQYHIVIIKKNAVKILSAVIEECLCGHMHVSRSSFASHLQLFPDERTCCWDHVGGWEGQNIVLFYSLLVLFNLLKTTHFICIHCGRNLDIGIACIGCRESRTQDLIRALQSALCHSRSPGPRLYTAHILSLFGLCGFSSKLGRKMKSALNETELADVELLLSNGESIRTHTAILSARCPNLLPCRNVLDHEEEINDGCSNKEALIQDRRPIYRVRMSNRVDSRAMWKILEYVYTGFTLAEDDLVKPLRILAKYCGLKSLQDMLQKEQPRWDADYPSYDLVSALEPTGHSFSDIILEAQSTERMTCDHSPCQLSTPHIHVHKIVLIMSSDYFRALFQSGMHESFSEVINVPVGWEALHKLVHWFYSGELPKVNPDCRWQNLSTDEQLCQLRSYVELSSLADFWFLEGVKEASLAAVTSCLKSSARASLELITFAVNLGQWKMVEVSVGCVAPLYPMLRDSSRLEELDEEVVNMLRSEYVQYSQRNHRCSS